MKNNLLTTKQFADLCKVEKRTLFYYDEINLLKPAEVASNGYRYYQPDQYDTMSMIKALQSIGMSLMEIKSLMKERDLSKNMAILNQQIGKLQEKQRELKMMEEFLIQTNEQLEEYLSKGLDQYYVEELTDQYLTVSAHEENDSFINFLTNGYHMGCIIDQYPASHTPSYIYKQVLDQEASNWIKPAGYYASIYRTTSNGNVKQMIDHWMIYLSEHIISTEGPLYLEDLASDLISMPQQEIIFKLTIKIEYSNL